MASKFEEAIPMASTGPQPHVVVMATDDAETTPNCCCCDDGCEEENEERGNWSCNFESILACISYGIGPGYLWMVPDGYSRQGGGTFVYAYMAMQILIGFPMVYLEMALGQYTSQGPIRAWRGVPILQGIGIGMVAMTAILSIYYNGVMAQILYYLFYVTGDLHTATSCDNPWNTENCYTSMCGKVVEYYGDDKMYNYTYTTCGHMSAASEYLDHYVLQRPDVRGYMGAVRGDLAGCLFLASLLLMAALSFGIKSLGKVAYVTTILPLFLLFLLFLRAVTLPGASDGIAYAMTPGPVWDASFGSGLISAVVLRLTLGFGGYTTLASYNRFHNNVLRDAIVVVFVELLVMIFCVLTMAGLYGYLANIGGVDIRDMIWSGTTMLFVTMVSGFSQLPSGSSWAALFFLCVFLLAFGCQITYLETVITSLMDLIPRRLIKRMPGKESGLLSKRALLHGVMTVAVCFLFFLLGLPYVTQGGEYLSNLVSHYNFIIQPYMFVLLECVALTYLYSPTCSRCCPAIRRWMSEVSHMLQTVCCFRCANVVNWFAAVTWVALIPLAMLFYLLLIDHWPSQSIFRYCEGQTKRHRPTTNRLGPLPEQAQEGRGLRAAMATGAVWGTTTSRNQAGHT
ncbi:sodium- and chloride-dependent glycine transporter 2-like [Branchiostoma floridae]|uniref:Sodium- and chloride-dependent glycine transporter 2-like n=1 Tax=Branchiostoma floridae TaxID=7739 RepID=A0A9J7LWM7_BRAFL|nr:sodium- and chloride-dependent glycine transporter 2-like [Branchiostoma floridae]